MLLLAAAAHATYPSVELNIDAVDFIVDPNMEWQAQRPLNKISKLYAEVFGLQFRGTPRVVVNARAFDKKEAYEAFTRDVTGNVVPHSAGFYLQRPDGSEELVVWRYAENDKLTEVILHEASHKLLRLGAGRRVPFALNEGLSDLVASSHTEPRTWVVELSSWRRRLVDEHRRAGQLPSAAKLLDISKAQWNAWQTPRYHLGYIYSWSLAGFLASSDEGRALLSAMLNRSSGSAGSVVEETWPDGLAGLDADWRAWIPKAPSDIRFVIEHPPVEGWLVCDGNVLIRKGPGVECPKTLIIRGTGR